MYLKRIHKLNRDCLSKGIDFESTLYEDLVLELAERSSVNYLPPVGKVTTYQENMWGLVQKPGALKLSRERVRKLRTRDSKNPRNGSHSRGTPSKLSLLRAHNRGGDSSLKLSFLLRKTWRKINSPESRVQYPRCFTAKGNVKVDMKNLLVSTPSAMSRKRALNTESQRMLCTLEKILQYIFRSIGTIMVGPRNLLPARAGAAVLARKACKICNQIVTT